MIRQVIMVHHDCKFVVRCLCNCICLSYLCASSEKFSMTLPTKASGNIWRITHTRASDIKIVIHCNDVKVVEFEFSDYTCTDSVWSQIWSSDVTTIYFMKANTGSDFYRLSQTGEINVMLFSTFNWFERKLL